MASQQRKTKIIVNTWKNQCRTGGNRQKVMREYNRILNSSILTENPISVNVRKSSEARVTWEPGSVQVFQNTVTVNDDCTMNTVDHDGEDFERHNEDQDSICSENFVETGERVSSSSDSEDDASDILKNLNFRENLRAWAIKENISQTSLKVLLLILNERFCDILPNDPRTLLKTPKNTVIKSLGNNSEYWHNGVFQPLKNILDNIDDLPTCINLNINFDGLPIHNSSKKEFWPILANIDQIDADPFVIGVYFGIGKPKCLKEYLEDFVVEMKNILQHGLEIKNRNIPVKIRCFICDSPARAFIKGVCNFNGMHGCLKCTTVGEYSHRSHTVTFSSQKFPSRNDNDFRAKKYEGHHKVDSPLLELPIDMVEDFPVGDSLHLIDLGIMKKLLVGWRNGNFGLYTTKWCARDITKVNDFLMKCKMPSEIHRSVRTLDCIAHWKGSEFRTFLHYVSIVALIDVLRDDVYHHFLNFFCAITICTVKKYSALLPVAKEMLQCFVDQYKDFYGVDYITSNVHNLLHIVDEVEKFGPLPTFNAYPFENKLYTIKKMLRQGNKPLSQLANRITEEAKLDLKTNAKENSEFNGPFVSKSLNMLKLHFNNFVLSTKSEDKYCLTKDNAIVEIKEIQSLSPFNVTHIHGYKMKNKLDIFVLPMKSSYLNMYLVEDSADNREEILIVPRNIQCKLVCIEHEKQLYFFPLLHTL
ncbi:hypothetical protein ABMA28_004771 [Loxostege sticticalis]|uniref:Transposase domain-containing protein n=1 Tax=Loxostege sticticalis TaxID=481309 RepID=A0ABD0SSE6_LOXSC